MVFSFDDLKVSDKITYQLSPDSIPWFLNTIFQNNKKLCFFCKNNQSMDSLEISLKKINSTINIIKFPSRDFQMFSDLSPTITNQTQRINALTKLTNFKINDTIVLVSFSSLIEMIPPKSSLHNNFIHIKKNCKSLDSNKIEQFLINNSYERVDVVRHKLDYSVRGSVIDIFPSNHEFPIRFDFFVDKIESIRVFDSMTQLSKSNIDNFYLFQASEINLSKELIENFRITYRQENFKENQGIYESISSGNSIQGLENFLPFFFKKLNSIIDYLENFKIIVNYDISEILENCVKNQLKNYRESKYNNLDLFKKNICSKKQILDKLKNYEIISISDINYFDLNLDKRLVTSKPNDLINLKKNQFKKNFEILVKNNPKSNFLFTSSGEKTKKEVKNLLNEKYKLIDLDNKKFTDNTKFFIKNLFVKSSFKYQNEHGSGLIVISDQDILGKVRYYSTKKKINADQYFFEISNISEGDLVVHSEHGIGRYNGLKNISLHDHNHECIEVEYAGYDKLFIPVENLELISRYNSRYTESTILDKLGSQNWQLRKANIKNKIKIIAHELIDIAASREVKKGKIFYPNSERFELFSSKFDYAETSDQLSAINDIIGDLCSGKPMDRLICGDVGFGKTEVAMRASFIVSDNNSQVAMLCPTTLLANQHFKSFTERFKDTGIKVLKLSRMESSTYKKEILEHIKHDKKLILIGTHSILNEEIEFNNLGLLIIDEEQSFGVQQKERIKKLKSNIHVLTITATPIPRTLQFSILGIKDISLITTPPINRTSIKTFLCKSDDYILKKAIDTEKLRNGQIFYVTPKIKYINDVQKKIKKLFPNLKIGIAHGRLLNTELIDTYNDFYNKDIDLLLSTSIIESGLDIPNANTIIIDRPNYFGLSQLYQIRGRVGRSTVQSYAYMLVKDIKDLSDKAKKRLNVINDLDSLGAGFQLASHDLDIRGSGNILGSEQSGHIKEVGVELYQKLIKDAINEIKDIKVIEDEWSPQINLGIPFFIPKEYIPEIDIRLNFYRRLSRSNNSEDLKKMLIELRDRFGKIPNEIFNLSKIIEIKNLSKLTNIKKIDLGIKGFIITFKENFKNYDKVIKIVQCEPEKFKFKKDNKLSYVGNWENKSNAIRSIKTFLKSLN